MIKMQFLIWFFPILFVFHDFEEIILIKPWLVKRKDYLSHKYPKLSKRLFQHFFSMSTSAFALGVAEQFVLITIITIASYIAGWYYLWLGAFIAFSLHMLLHLIQAIVIKSYIPAVVTSVICLPGCIYILNLSLIVTQAMPIMLTLFSFVASVFMVINLVAVHKGMDIFDKWLLKYQNG